MVRINVSITCSVYLKSQAHKLSSEFQPFLLEFNGWTGPTLSVRAQYEEKCLERFLSQSVVIFSLAWGYCCHDSTTLCYLWPCTWHHTQNQTASKLTLVLNSWISSLQGKRADSRSKQGDGSGSSQHACCQQYGPFGHGVAEHLSPEGWSKTALWAECKCLNCHKYT